MLKAGVKFPEIAVHTLGGAPLTLGQPMGDADWQMVVVYRGKHCPICKTYIGKLSEMQSTFADIGVEVVTVSADPEDKARAFVEDAGVDLPVGYDLSLEQMTELGLFVSDPRSPKETDSPFAEPAVFVVNGDGELQIVDVSNAPFARPDLEMLAKGLKFIRENDYPVRGTKIAA